ncbi:MAG: hypothetical protein AAB553_02790 [Patescibacteria group bacterium]
MRRGAEGEKPHKRIRKIVPPLAFATVVSLAGCANNGEAVPIQSYPSLRLTDKINGTYDFSLEQRDEYRIAIVGHDRDGIDLQELEVAAGTLGQLDCEIDPNRPAEERRDDRPNPAEVTVFSLNGDCVTRAVDALEEIEPPLPTA